jgi:glycosyltransferase involved in cell wall biosynthesis
MIALIITTYNRPDYLQRCLDSLKQVDYPKGTQVYIIDDRSTDARTIELINSFTLGEIPVTKYFKPANKGIKDSLIVGYSLAYNQAEYFINLDSDAIVKPDFINRLVDLKKRFPDNIVSGFNSRNTDGRGQLRNPVISEHEDYVIKKHANGINMCVSKAEYDSIIKPALYQHGNWDFNSTSGEKNTVITVPSVVQHIGIDSSMGHDHNPDIAFDFDPPKIILPTVTLLGTDCRDKVGIQRAAEICTREIKFGSVKIITECLYHGIQEYSRYYIKELTKHVDTEHVLIIHADGYIQNVDAWDDSWLQYDYIGATWGYKDNMNVGNGGFTLRSKKLLDILSKLELDNYHPEDDIICRQLRPWLEKEHGIKFAPEEVANKFSIEAYGASVFPNGNKYSGQFGFHGYGVTHLPIPPNPKVQDGIQQRIITTGRNRRRVV